MRGYSLYFLWNFVIMLPYAWNKISLQYQKFIHIYKFKYVSYTYPYIHMHMYTHVHTYHLKNYEDYSGPAITICMRTSYPKGGLQKKVFILNKTFFTHSIVIHNIYFINMSFDSFELIPSKKIYRKFCLWSKKIFSCHKI